jgi:hypothetical protein
VKETLGHAARSLQRVIGRGQVRNPSAWILDAK